MDAVQSFKVTIDGVELHWTERGAGPPLVVLHGLGDSQHTWGAVTSELASRYRVLSLDLPGCGLSGRPNASYTLDWQARVTAKWLDHTGLDDFDVLGHSYGGGVALWLLLYRAKSIGKLALVAPGGLGREVVSLLRLAAVFAAMESGGQFLMGPITRLLVQWHGGSLTADEREILWRMNGSPGAGRAFVRTLRDVIGWRGQTRQLLDRIGEIAELPSIALFWGERDHVIPIRHGEALCRALDHCSLWRLPRVGHFAHWEAPKPLARAILTYLGAPRERCSLRGAAKQELRRAFAGPACSA